MGKSSDYSYPAIGDYAFEQNARVLAALPAAGAWDVAPPELVCPGFDAFTLFCRYERGAAGGAFDLKIEVSQDAVVWYQLSIYSPGAVNAGADTISEFQRELLRYTSTDAPEEFVVFGPINGNASFDYLRLSGRESGDIDNPGNLGVVVQFR